MLPSCIQIAMTLALLTRVSLVRMCWKPEEVTYDIGFQSFLSFHFEDGQNFESLKSPSLPCPSLESTNEEF
jgi:hypothetical protein